MRQQNIFTAFLSASALLFGASPVDAKDHNLAGAKMLPSADTPAVPNPNVGILKFHLPDGTPAAAACGVYDSNGLEPVVIYAGSAKSPAELAISPHNLAFYTPHLEDPYTAGGTYTIDGGRIPAWMPPEDRKTLMTILQAVREAGGCSVPDGKHVNGLPVIKAAAKYAFSHPDPEWQLKPPHPLTPKGGLEKCVVDALQPKGQKRDLGLDKLGLGFRDSHSDHSTYEVFGSSITSGLNGKTFANEFLAMVDTVPDPIHHSKTYRITLTISNSMGPHYFDSPANNDVLVRFNVGENNGIAHVSSLPTKTLSSEFDEWADDGYASWFAYSGVPGNREFRQQPNGAIDDLFYMPKNAQSLLHGLLEIQTKIESCVAAKPTGPQTFFSVLKL